MNASVLMTTTKPARKRRIFINYRRSDNTDFVERIRDWFVLRYGRENVFMDFDNIPPFTLFADFIRERVADCDVLVAIIGPQWIPMLKERLNQPDEEDYVQVEIKLALEHHKWIAPICIKGAAVPRAAHLPPELRPLLDYNVAHLNSGRDFLDNIERIIDAVEKKLDELEVLKMVKHDIQATEQNGLNIWQFIKDFELAEEQGDFPKALTCLERIRASGYAPAYYPLDDYEQQIREKIQLQQIESDYDFIRVMAERALRKPRERNRVWSALQTFWQSHPGYDPDNLVARFNPAPQPLPEMPVLEVDESDTLLLDEEYADTLIIPALQPYSDPLEFELSLLNQLSSLDESRFDDMFASDHLSSLVESSVSTASLTLTLDQAQKAGLLEWNA